MTDRPTPQAVDSERALLGGLILDSQGWADVAAILDPGDFYAPHHGVLWTLLREMVSARIGIDLVTVLGEIQARGLGERCGGAGYVAELPEFCPSTANLVYYADLVRASSQRRHLIAVGAAISRYGYGQDARIGDADLDSETDVRTAAGYVVADLLSLVTDGEHGPTNAAAAVAEWRMALHRDRTSDRAPGLPSGIDALDEALNGGPRPTDLVVLAARPGMGKTALALTLTDHVCGVERRRVGWFSLEMSRAQLTQRLVGGLANVPSDRVRDPRKLTDDEVARLEYAATDVAGYDLELDDRAGVTIDQIRLQARRWATQGDLALLVVDYLQLVHGSHPRARPVEVAGEVSRVCKEVAKELGCTVLLLSQLNREAEKRADHRPLPSDLRDSGQIEQDADVILFIYREWVYNSTADPHAAELIVAKYRGGATGKVPAVFDGPIMRFRDYTLDDRL